MNMRLMILGSLFSSVCWCMEQAVEDYYVTEATATLESCIEAELLCPKNYDKDKEPLHYAAENGLTEQIRVLLAQGVNVDTQDSEGKTALHLAAIKNNTELVEVLIGAGAKVNAHEKEGFTPLTYISFVGRSGYGEVIKLLLKNGAFLDAPGAEPFLCPLHWAIAGGCRENIELMVKIGANVNAYDAFLALTPLILAVGSDTETERFEICKFLLANGADVKLPSLGSRGSLFGDKTYETALHVACEKGPKELVQLLIDHKADVHAATKHGMTSLHWACLAGNKEIVELLLSHHAEVMVRDAHGNTPLHCAAYRGHAAAVRTLLGLPVEVDAIDEQGFTPLHLAAGNGHADVVELLLAHRAEIEAKNRYLETPLLTVLRQIRTNKECYLTPVSKDLRKEDYNGDFRLGCNKGRARVVVDVLLAHNARLDQVTSSGMSCVALAKERESFEIADMLLAKGAHNKKRENLEQEMVLEAEEQETF